MTINLSKEARTWMSRAKRVVWLSVCVSDATEEGKKCRRERRRWKLRMRGPRALDDAEWGPLSAVNDGHDPLRCRLASSFVHRPFWTCGAPLRFHRISHAQGRMLFSKDLEYGTQIQIVLWYVSWIESLYNNVLVTFLFKMYQFFV